MRKTSIPIIAKRETETAVSCEEESCDVFVGEGGFVDVDQS